jgi:hypothetical protein
MLHRARKATLIVATLCVLSGAVVVACQEITAVSPAGVVLVCASKPSLLQGHGLLPRSHLETRDAAGALSDPEMMLAQVNKARVADGLEPIQGLSPVLDELAYQGAVRFQDPGVPGFPWKFEGSVWAKGLTPARAVVAWLDQDGWEGARTINVACTSPTAPGCNAHRRILLTKAFGGPRSRLLAGAAVVKVGGTWSEAMVIALGS